MTEFIEASDGVPLAFDVAGDGRPVLLIHGFAASRVITWRNTEWIGWLVRAGHRVIAPDCRGHGESGKPHDPRSYDDRRLAADAVAILDSLSIPVADVMGYSMGGYLTANLLRESPGRFRRAVMAGVGETYFRFWPERSERVAQGLLAESLVSLSDPLQIEFRTFAERAGNDLVALAACMRRQRRLLTEEELGRLKHPVLVVCGEEDTVSGRPEPLARLLGNARAVVVPKRNHHSTVGDLRYKQAAREFLAE